MIKFGKKFSNVAISIVKIGNNVSIFDLLIIISLPVIFSIWNIVNYSGPAYLSDEIGYLSKAAFLGGHVIDKATKYHAGYAFFLAPLFAISTSPWVVWKGVLIVNGCLWVGSFAILRHLLFLWFPEVTAKVKSVALLVSTLYPAWFLISGYAFSSSAFVFVFMLSLGSLFTWNGKNSPSLFLHGFLIGFLYWIHPTAIGVILASFFVVFLVCVKYKKYLSFLLYLVTVLLLFYSYQKWIGPSINDAMTPMGYKVHWHYPHVINLIFGLADPNVFVSFVVRVFGEFSYGVIGSFGLVLFGLVFFMRRSNILKFFISPRSESQERHTYSDVESLLFLFLPLSLLLIIVMGSGMFGVFRISGADHWIYGRYEEEVFLPLLACGLVELSKSRRNTRCTIAIFSFIVLCLTGWAMDHIGATVAPNNLVNTLAFWPQYLFEGGGFLLWEFIGTAGVLCFCILGWRISIIVMGFSLVICSINQVEWHRNILNSYSNPSSLVKLVRENFPQGSCVAFDDAVPMAGEATFSSISESLENYDINKYKYNLSLFQLERYSLYSFYFFNYHYRRMSAEEWRSDCNGPLLTYEPRQYVGHKGEYIVGREIATNLFIVTKRENLIIPQNLRLGGGVTYYDTSDDTCYIAGCFSMQAQELAKFTEVGKLKEGKLLSTNRSGFLFFGPYNTVSPGSYKVVVRGRWRPSNTMWVDVVMDHGKKIIAKKTVYARHSKLVNEKIVVPFKLPIIAKDLEVRFHVGVGDQASVVGYRIVLNNANMSTSVRKTVADKISDYLPED